MLIVALTPVLGGYMARVYEGERAPADRVFLPFERLLYRAMRVDPEREQPWTVYTRSLIAFSLVSILGLYLLQRVQGVLPLDPTGVSAVPPLLAFNTAVSFVTNTNWQNYAGETTMSHLTQMAGLTVQNFVSAAVGMAVAVALIRGIVRRRQATIGNFWVDLVRGVTRILLPLAFVFALVLAGRVSFRTLDGPATVHDRRRRVPDHPRRPHRQPGSDQGARHQRRRHLPTRTPLTRSRTRPGSPTSSRSLPSSSSRSRSPPPSAAWPATGGRAGSCSP